MSTLGERLKSEREARGWSQNDVARRVSNAGFRMTQGGIAQIERRGKTSPRSIVQLAQALGVSVHWLQSNRGDKHAGVIAASEDDQPGLFGSGPSTVAPAAATTATPAVRSPALGARSLLPVHSSAQGGSEGAMVLSSDPVAWVPREARLDGVREAYGCFVSGDSMEPAYERGNLLLVNPAAAVTAGDDCLFLRAADDGTRYVLVKRLVRVSEQSWTVRQYNPPRTYTLSRKEWQQAHLVIGKYNRAS